MEYTLTLVARDPKYSSTDRFTDDEPSDGEGDDTIRDVMKRLRERRNKEANVVYRMSTVADIVACSEHYADKYKRSPDRLQLIGHGQPGALSIGHAWLPPGSPIVQNHLAYALNSDPAIYAQIKKNVAPKKGSVGVLGCDSGRPTAGNGTIADGPTLLFALTRVLEVPVDGPVCLIGDDNFNDDGLFNEPGWLMRANNLNVTPPGKFTPRRRAWLFQFDGA